MHDSEPVRRTLGPVGDFDRHLPTVWWRTLFNALYLKTDGDVVGNSTLTSNDVDAVVAAAALKHTDRILEAAQERTLAAREAQVANRRDTDSKASVVAQGAST